MIYNSNPYFFFLLVIVLLWSPQIQGQTTGSRAMHLSEVILMAKEQSIAFQQAANLKTLNYWEWKTHLSNYKPQLLLNGTLPDFVRTFQQVVQPNGSISFQAVSNNNSSIDFSLNQSLALTGGTLFAGVNLQRFDDFDRKQTRYNGAPFAIGYSQPLFGFNQLKWNKKINPIIFEESKRAYNQTLEEIAATASDLFFDLLLAQANSQIAEINLTNNDTIYEIAKERFALGKLSKNDVLQLRLEVLKSKKSLVSARQNLEIASLQLSSYIGYRSNETIQLAVPSDIPLFEVDTQKALEQAYANRADALAFHRKKLEAERDVVRSKRENGLNIELSASFGVSNTASSIEELYRDPKDQETLQLAFQIPLLDWGRAKSRRETALAQKQLTTQEIAQDQVDFEKSIFTLVSLFNRLKTGLELTQEADQIAQERYQIARQRFLLGDMSITDLSIALQEKDQAKRDYISSLRDYWGTYFDLRAQTLFDFEKGLTIKN